MFGPRSTVHSVAHPTSLESLPVGFLPVRLVTEDLSFFTMQKRRELRDVGRGRVGRDHGVNEAALVGPDVELHPEVPVVALGITNSHKAKS